LPGQLFRSQLRDVHPCARARLPASPRGAARAVWEDAELGGRALGPLGSSLLFVREPLVHGQDASYRASVTSSSGLRGSSGARSQASIRVTPMGNSSLSWRRRTSRASGTGVRRRLIRRNRNSKPLLNDPAKLRFFTTFRDDKQQQARYRLSPP
jgi:hypothetical protein